VSNTLSREQCCVTTNTLPNICKNAYNQTIDRVNMLALAATLAGSRFTVRIGCRTWHYPDDFPRVDSLPLGHP